MAKQVMPKKAAGAASPAVKKTPSGATDVRAQLAGIAGTWSATPTPEGGAFGNVPDGKYKAQIENPVLRNGGKNKDQLQINWPCRIIGPTHANRLAFANTGLTTEQGIGIAKGYLDILGLTVPESIEELPETLAAAHGKIVEITLRTKAGQDGNKYQNTYINGLIEEEGNGVEAPAETPAEAPAEETPSFVGSSVSFELDGNNVTGEVKSQDGETLTVDVAGTEYEVPVSVVSLAETEPEPEPEVAAEPADEEARFVKFSLEDGSEVTAQVTEVTSEGNLKCVDSEGTEYEVPASEAVDVEAGTAEEGVEEAEVAPPPAPKKPAIKAKTPPAPAAKAKPAPVAAKKPAVPVAAKKPAVAAKKPAKK